MAEEVTEAIQNPTGTSEVPEGVDAPTEALASDATQAPALETPTQTLAEAAAVPETPVASEPPSEPATPKEPDAIQPYIDKACETIQHAMDDTELNKFLRAHIKTFREEWDAMSDAAKDTYLHMMTSQLLQRKASTTRIMIYEEFKLPVPSAQTTLFESLKQSQIKPRKRKPVLLMPPNLRPTYSLKK